MSEAEFTFLGLEAGRLNALDGITGLLVFNGERFCQTIEGAPEAIENLVERLKRDPRHEDFAVLDDGDVPTRRFRSWDMQLLAVPGDKQAALDLARLRFEAEADFSARAKIYQTVEGAFA
ncbi:BLUF domain-containing protein [Sphingomonas sp. ID1715]|nr:BLUF domain-containing protein [Sphingomonas sp. ID1715]